MLIRVLLLLLCSFQPAGAETGLAVSVDPQGPYLILATPAAARKYAPAIERAVKLHPGCKRASLDPRHPEASLPLLRKLKPRYTLIFLLPNELNVNFAWRWMELTASLDGDPFVDTRTGLITGDATRGYFERVQSVLEGRESVPPLLVDNLGPAPVAQKLRGSTFVPAVAARLGGWSFAHAEGKLTQAELGLMATAGVLHLGGHGSPERVLGGMQARDWEGLSLPPAFVFNGCCFGGVTDSSPSFCLAVLRRRPLAYFASLFADHGMPVYQEMDRLAWRGGSAGDLIKGTQDEVILGLGGGPPKLPRLKAGELPTWTGSQQMLYGTASRVLFGDPALRLGVPSVSGPFRLTGDTAVLLNTGLPATLTDTFHGDLCSQPNLFNARALLEWPVARGKLAGIEVEVWGKKLRHRVVAAAVEDGRVLRIQVDVESSGLFRSPFLAPGALVRCRFTPP